MAQHGKKNVRYVFRPWRRDRSGKKIWAKDYGLKAWPIPIDQLKSK